MKLINRIVAIILLWLVLFIIVLLLDESHSQAYEYRFTDVQKMRADFIADEVISHYGEYGCLPSVAIAQAYLESQLGENGIDNFNYWGLGGQLNFKYWNLHDGVHAYMKYINNGHYVNAPFERDYRKHIRYILDGNYCVPEGNYQSNVEWCYRTFNLGEYDKKLFRKLKNDKRKKLMKKVFTVSYNPNLPHDVIQVDSLLAKNNTTICLYENADNYCLSGIYKARKGQSGTVISTSDKSLLGKNYTIYIYDGVRG